MARPLIRQIVAVHAGDDHVVELHVRDGLGDVARLVGVRWGRVSSRRDRAEATPARARVAEHHERCGAAVPALTDVRALRLLTDRVELEFPGAALDRVVSVAARHADHRKRLIISMRTTVHPVDSS